MECVDETLKFDDQLFECPNRHPKPKLYTREAGHIERFEPAAFVEAVTDNVNACTPAHTASASVIRYLRPAKPLPVSDTAQPQKGVSTVTVVCPTALIEQV